MAARHRDPFLEPSARAAAGRAGMLLFLVTLGVLFAATIVGMIAVRVSRGDPELWLPRDAPPLPSGLMLSTIVLATSSLTLVRSTGALRRDDTQGFARWMLVTLGLAAVFLLVQAACWIVLVRGDMTWRGSLYGWLFYVLTGLHALHVIGGLVPMAVVARRAVRGWYDASNRAGVERVAMYWHFLDAVWIVLYLVLWLTR